MALSRILEPEVMDSDEEARDYDAMDHSGVNAAFCTDLVQCAPDLSRTLDVGTGTALIPIELCRRERGARVIGVDLSPAMLRVALRNIELAGLSGVSTVELSDAKGLRFEAGSFHSVMSNSILHHVPDPREPLREMKRLLAPGGLLFVRDLFRPEREADVLRLVETYASDANAKQRGLFDASLRAALTVDEMRAIAVEVGLGSESVRATSDRHFTLIYRAPQ